MTKKSGYIKYIFQFFIILTSKAKINLDDVSLLYFLYNLLFRILFNKT